MTTSTPIARRMNAYFPRPDRFTYSRWRHGGWYVHDNHYPSGAVGCVSRNYPDGKWRIVCDPRPNAYELYTYRTRDEAALAEFMLVHLFMCPECSAVGESQDVYCNQCGAKMKVSLEG